MISPIKIKNPLVFSGLLIVSGLFVVAVLAPYLSPYDPLDQNLLARLQPPSLTHFFGTDDLGRDVFSRILYGSRVSLTVGMIAVGIAVTVGISIGLLAGYGGRFLDNLLMRFVDVLLCFPTFFLILMVIAFLEPSISKVMMVIGLTSWTGIARLVRAETLAIKEREFVLAARIAGIPNWRILLVQILPNVSAPVIVSATLGLGGAILAESALSFLGLGVQPPLPSWGNILTAGKDYIYLAWWLSLFPGLAILITVLGFNLLGEGLREWLDPRQKKTER